MLQHEIKFELNYGLLKDCSTYKLCADVIDRQSIGVVDRRKVYNISIQEEEVLFSPYIAHVKLIFEWLNNEWIDF